MPSFNELYVRLVKASVENASEEELKKAIEKHLGFEMPDKNWDEIKGAFYNCSLERVVHKYFVD